MSTTPPSNSIANRSTIATSRVGGTQSMLGNISLAYFETDYVLVKWIGVPETTDGSDIPISEITIAHDEGGSPITFHVWDVLAITFGQLQQLLKAKINLQILSSSPGTPPSSPGAPINITPPVIS